MEFDFEQAEQLAKEIGERLDELLKMEVEPKSRDRLIEELTFTRIWHGERAFVFDWMAYATNEEESSEAA